MEFHSLHAPPKEKHFKHYLFEFFMLFLAVSLGFLVENARDRIADHKKEKEYIISIAEDIHRDIDQLDSVIAKRRIKGQMMDSLLYLINNGATGKGSDIYYYARWLPRTFIFFPDDRTILQLNSGNWRLIRNNKASDALLSYNRTVRVVANFIEHREESIIQQIYPSLHKLFDNRVFVGMVDGLSFNRPTGNPLLLSTDKSALNEFCNEIHFANNANLYYILNSEQLIKEARKALSTLKENYQID